MSANNILSRCNGCCSSEVPLIQMQRLCRCIENERLLHFCVECVAEYQQKFVPCINGGWARYCIVDETNNNSLEKQVANVSLTDK
jgi:hypothetical protein